MFKKKVNLESLLEKLSIAKINLENSKNKHYELEQQYAEADCKYLQAKHAYEDALKQYNLYLDENYAQQEIVAGRTYFEASNNVSNIKSKLLDSRRCVKKAEKTYKKLQRIVEKTQEAEQMGG